MKKNLNAVCCILLLSFVLHITGISAKTVTYMSNFTVPAWSQGVEVDTLTKDVSGPERLYVSAYFNRDLYARIVSTNSFNEDYDGDTGYYWKIINTNDTFQTTYLGADANAAASGYSNFSGDKTLYLKTSGFWFDTTSVSGQWYVNG